MPIAPESARSAPQSAHGTQTAPALDGQREAALATFEGGRITVADMEAAIASKDPRTRARLASPEARRAFLDELVSYDLLVLEAERRGYGRHPAVIEAGKKAAIDAMITRDLAVDPAKVPAADVAAYLAAHRDEYGRPATRRASHIEVATEAEARALIAELRGATREQFAKVARERSRDERSRKQGGELGYFDREGKSHAKAAAPAVPRELAEAAFALAREGQIAKQPIATAQGFSVLMLTGRMAAIEPRLADLDPRLRAELAEERTVEVQRELLAQLREQLAPEVHPELVSQVVLEPAAPPDRPQGFPAAPPDPRAAPKVVEPDGY